MVFLPVLIFILGLIIGSFLNVVILRMNTGRSATSGRSACMHCGQTLGWKELVPVVSFLGLGGKCRTCKAPISFQYPVVELISGIVWVALYAHFPVAGWFSAYSWLSFAFSVVIASLLIVLAIYDVRHKILPDSVMYPFMLLALAAIAVKGTLFPEFSVTGALVGGVWVGLPFFLLWAISKGRAMGFGDVKLALGIGWLLGLSMGFAAIIIAFWIGALAGLFLIAIAHTHSMKSQLPFGPFLILAVLIVVLGDISITQLFPPIL
ncbi:prepilin peptidase [Candidatus Nomurabacteria bacterium]|nr:prepilin peptidase [Candidatus Nomurabacteria bacterium]